MSELISETHESRASVFQSNLPLEAKLEQARTELLDLSARNRLLNIPRSGKSAKILEIIDEQSVEIYRLLVREQKALTFLPGKAALGKDEPDADAEEIAELVQPEEDGTDERGVALRHTDTRLQTRLTPAGLQKRLLDLYYDARTLEEEQGVNILFLAVGTLKWIDPNNTANSRYAPLVLVPVALDRGNAAEKFKLRWRQEDLAANLSLEAYLERVHGMKLPVFEPGDDFDIGAYLAAVAEAVEGKAEWAVNPDDIVLGFFSFAKFLMYRDLDPQNWPSNAKLGDHAIVRPLLADGFREDEPLLGEEDHIDHHVAPSEMVHIVDSDGSQTRAVHEVRAGRNIVIQGPPGTGKSQTIANIIASAVADGKTVLFVAEKMAALEVVKRRLDNTGVGDACLEVHSNKANKRTVLEDLRRTWELGAPKGADLTTLTARLTEARDVLNAHAERLHQPNGPAGYTPYEVIGHLTRLKQEGQAPTDGSLEDAVTWSAEDFRRRRELLSELAERVVDLGVPAEHLWCGIELPTVLPPEVDRFEKRLAELVEKLDALSGQAAEAAATLQTTPLMALSDWDELVELARRVAEAPDLPPEAIGNAAWAEQGSGIVDLLRAGERQAEVRAALAENVREAGWTADLSFIRATFDRLPQTFTDEQFAQARRLSDGVLAVAEVGRRLVTAVGREGLPSSYAEYRKLQAIADRVAAAPDADVAAFGADLWDSGVERAADLAKAVAALEVAKGEVGGGLSDAAWSADLSKARQTLAAHGSGAFRLFSGEWRAANRLVQSFLTDPKTQLQRRLALLDALARGQAAQRTIQTEDAFGRSAFGADWRGERSASAPLAAVVEWMRSLKGLGAEPRIIASRGPDRNLVASLTRELARRTEAVALELSALWSVLSAKRSDTPTSAATWEECGLEGLLPHLGELGEADAAYSAIAIKPEREIEGRVATLKLLAEGQAAAGKFAELEPVGPEAFGSKWRGAESEWSVLQDAATWIRENLDIHQIAARIPNRRELAQTLESALSDRDTLTALIEGFLADIQAEADALLPPGASADVPTVDLSESLCQWRDGTEQLSKWVEYRGRSRHAGDLGLEDIVDRLHTGELKPEGVLPFFEMTYFEAVLALQVREVPELLTFEGELHDRTVRSFVDLDRERIRQSAIEVVRSHHRTIPRPTGGAAGPLGVLKGEIARKRGHMPIRKLMQQAGPAVQALKPVFMMSPLSVAQFLPPGTLTFDLLVMDEASQIQPVDAIGAIARARQVVVVGDPQQLPPTAFFSKMVGSSDSEDDDGGATVADIESILGLFTARGLPLRMLRWHYRSRHESLIAVSNRQFYENKLVIVPSPYTHQSGLGLRFHHIRDGIFESGTTRTNPIEAKAVAQAIIDHAIRRPEHSLGVVAFSAAQRRAILDQLEILRRHLPPEKEAFFQAHAAEPFFVKNLENVQGDERDVILISVGYGPTAPGTKPPMRFGPLGQDGGERRLNVLISRAKRRCEVFSSMTDEDIDPDFASTRKGVFAFKLFMHFARTGRMSLAESAGQDREDIFEAQVAQALHARGYQVHRNVGVSGLFVDIAVADPDKPDRYILGVECDGLPYAGARFARDRDRLRRTVLEDHGWIVHRIWSTDWLKRPKEQLDRLVNAIEVAKAELATRTQSSGRTGGYEVQAIERENITEMGLVAVEAFSTALTPYTEAEVSKPTHLDCELHETPMGVLSSLAELVVLEEGPVHLDEIVTRLRDAWGVKRAGGRIQDAVLRAVALAANQRRIIQDGHFYSAPGATPVVRDRSAARSPGLRKPEALPPSEVGVALTRVIGQNFGATADQAIQAVSRAFGFKATSAQLRDVIDAVLQDLIAKQILAESDMMIVLGPHAPPMGRDESPASPLEKLIAEGEHERLEFKQTLRWDIRQATVNKKLEDVVVKTIAAFANHKGGTLLIGVRDDGGIDGLEPDFNCTGGGDKFDLHLTNLINSRFSHSFRAAKVCVAFPRIGERTVCRVDVERSRTPVYVALADQSGAVTERLFVRMGASSQEIPPSQIVAFVKEHFPTA